MPLFFCVALLPCCSIAQEYAYAHYGLGEGLAGSTVYCVTQDKDGFMWIGTETGVSRFDGTHFKNITTRDGLPDLEVVQLFCDSRGRVWMGTLRKSVCYYYQGRIHTEQNDPVLGRIRVAQTIENFAEDAAGNILLQEQNVLHLLRPDGSVTDYESVDGEPLRKCWAVSPSASGHFLVAMSGKIIEFSGGKCLHSQPIPFYNGTSTDIAMSSGGALWKDLSLGYSILSFATNGIIRRLWGKQYYRSIAFSTVGDSLVYCNTTSGSYEYNLRTGEARTYLPGVAVSRVFRDASGDLWFTTMGAGLYRLISNDVRSIRFTMGHGERVAVTAIARIGHELWIGENHNSIFRLALPGLSQLDRRQYFGYALNRILAIDTTTDGKVLAGGDCALQEAGRDFHSIGGLFTGGVKSMVRIDDHRLLVAMVSGAGIVSLPLHFYSSMTDTLWRERTTVAFYTHDTIYIGTLNGLYRFVKDAPPVFLGEKVPFLRKRVSAIAEAADGTLWVGSYDDAGIIGYKNGRVVAALTRREGLTSDICRCLRVHDNVLWIGTDKGLNRIEPGRTGYLITRYGSRDGLASDIVNVVLVDSPRVYVGTSEGLSFFDEKQPANGEGCRLQLESVMNSGRERIADTGGLVIPWRDKDVRLEFAGISYRSAGDISYRYRMVGLDSNWRETRENVVEYPDLPSGEYEWQLTAVNKFGKQSRLLRLPITVTIQWWKRPWVVVTTWLLSIGLLSLLLSYRLESIRRGRREKDDLLQRMSDLENIALKSQMNPHFLFNCLNSIQLLISSGDTAGSNAYIAGLARLVRLTLHNSSRTFVPIGDEVDYLSSYLSLEKLRFKEKIDYAIVVDPAIDRMMLSIPPMLIQPYVENALLHGLPPKKGGKGFIRIHLHIAGDQLVVTIEDNGIGRRAAGAQKAGEPTGYPSKGMSLTEDRIGIMNTVYAGDAGIEIIDLEDGAGEPAGTRITLRLPLLRREQAYS